MSYALTGRRLLPLFASALSMFFTEGCLYVPHLFRGAPIAFRVVDDADSAPLPNVVVVAHWEVIHLTVAHPAPVGTLLVLEAVGDAEGRVRFPAWGPKLVGPMKTIGWGDPGLVLFKEGYVPRAVKSAYKNEFDASFTRRSDWDGKTIRLHRPESERDYAASLDFLGESLLSFALPGFHCEWRSIPTMLSRGLAEGEKYPYARPSEPSFWNEEYMEGRGAPSRCGSMREYLKRYGHEN